MRTKQMTTKSKPYFIVISKSLFSSEYEQNPTSDISMVSSISLQRSWSMSDLDLSESVLKREKPEHNDLNSNVNIRKTSIVAAPQTKSYEERFGKINVITRQATKNISEGRQ